MFKRINKAAHRDDDLQLRIYAIMRAPVWNSLSGLPMGEPVVTIASALSSKLKSSSSGGAAASPSTAVRCLFPVFSLLLTVVQLFARVIVRLSCCFLLFFADADAAAQLPTVRGRAISRHALVCCRIHMDCQTCFAAGLKRSHRRTNAALVCQNATGLDGALGRRWHIQHGDI
jgi:hypothetical protein